MKTKPYSIVRARHERLMKGLPAYADAWNALNEAIQDGEIPSNYQAGFKIAIKVLEQSAKLIETDGEQDKADATNQLNEVLR